jgi:hypothetical protein
MKRSLVVLLAACGPKTVAPTPVSDPAPAPKPALSCEDRIERAHAHVEAVSAAADKTIRQLGNVPQLVSAKTVDGTGRDPEALVIRYAGGAMTVGKEPAIAWRGNDSVAAVVKLVSARAPHGIELELAPAQDASGLDELFAALGRVHVVVLHSSLDPKRVILPDTPAWVTDIFAIPVDQRAPRIRDAFRRAITGCESLEDAFSHMAGPQDFVKLPLAACKCETSNPEALGTLAATAVAVAEVEIGWIDVHGPVGAAATTDALVQTLTPKR